MAGRITFGSGYDPVGSAYRDMAKATANNGGSMAEEKTKTKATAEENALRKLLGLEQK